MQKIKFILMLLLLSVASCDDGNSKLIGKWTLLTEENVKSELIIERNKSFYFKNMPLSIICPEGGSNFQDVSGDWSADYDERVDFSIDNIKPNPCNVSSFLINGFYEKFLFFAGDIAFYPGDPDSKSERMGFVREKD